MGEEKKASSDDSGMVKYGVQPDTLTKEATIGVEDKGEEAAEKKKAGGKKTK